MNRRKYLKRFEVPVLYNKEQIKELDRKIQEAYKELNITFDEFKRPYKDNIMLFQSEFEKIIQKYFEEKNGIQNT